MRLSVVVPIYNEDESIEALVRNLVKTLEGDIDDFEVILVDDGSTDGTPLKLKLLSANDNRIVCIKFRRNFGQHAAMFAGMARSEGELVATIDADLQNNPVDLLRLIKEMDGGTDIVCAYRSSRKDSLFRKIPSRIVNYFAYLVTGVKLRDFGCSLRVYRRKVIEELVKYREAFTAPHALINWLGFRMKEMEVSHSDRKYGSSKMDVLSLVKMAYDLVTGFSLIPVQIISLVGKGLTIFGLLLCLLFGLVSIFSGEMLFDFTLFIALSMFYTGLIVLAISVVGEYAARAYIESKKRPLYIIDEKEE